MYTYILIHIHMYIPTWEHKYVLYNLLWEYKQGNYISSVICATLYYAILHSL